MGINVQDFLDEEIKFAESFRGTGEKHRADKLLHLVHAIELAKRIRGVVNADACMTYTDRKLPEKGDFVNEHESEFVKHERPPASQSAAARIILYNFYQHEEHEREEFFVMIQGSRLDCWNCLRDNCDKRDPEVPVAQVCKRAQGIKFRKNRDR